MCNRELMFGAVLLVLAACHGVEQSDVTSPLTGPVPRCDTGQIFGTGAHSGTTCAPINGLGLRAQVVIDPSATQENADLGFYGVHAGAALTAGAWAYIPVKVGYTDLFDKGTQTWSVQGLRWQAGAPVKQWQFDSAWKPFDVLNPFGTTNGYESLFQPVLAGGVLYVPGPSGTISRVNPLTGAVLSVVDPFAGSVFESDPATIVNSALSAGDDGSIYYTVVAWPPDGTFGGPVRGSWLVRVSPYGAITLQPWASIATAAIGVKQGADLCSYQFTFASPVPTLFPPSPDATPPQKLCRPQRPTTNAAPAITADGRVVVVSTSNNATSYAYLIEVDATTLAPVWAASLRDHILDGCGVKIPFGSDPLCPLGTPLGVDPLTNEAVAGREAGIMEVAPMVAPDGSIYIGSYSGGYDNNQGHLTRFSATGQFLGLTDHGWEITPKVDRLINGTWSLVMDLNRFSPTTGDGTGLDGDYITARLNPDLTVRAETHAVLRADAVANDFLNGQPAIDRAGNAYALDATGTIYKIDRTGTVVDQLELGVSLETLSAEPSWGTDENGSPVLYVPFAGTMWVVGEGGSTAVAAPVERAARRAGLHRARGAVVDAPDSSSPLAHPAIKAAATPNSNPSVLPPIVAGGRAPNIQPQCQALAATHARTLDQQAADEVFGIPPDPYPTELRCNVTDCLSTARLDEFEWIQVSCSISNPDSCSGSHCYWLDGTQCEPLQLP